MMAEHDRRSRRGPPDRLTTARLTDHMDGPGPDSDPAVYYNAGIAQHDRTDSRA
jgi:hypothetical protein